MSQTGQPLNFTLLAQEGAARAGLIQTRRGVIETPVFMPVGTAGTVKGVRFEALESSEMDARIILGNTYHLWLRPGAETVRACGGLHKFIGWERAMLTDSGGFQVWSLTDLRRLNEDGVEFRSHLDGSKKFLSPEVSMEIQAALGAEIVMAFDECPPGQASHATAQQSLELTARWARRSRVRFDELQAESRQQAAGSRRPGESRQQAAGRRQQAESGQSETEHLTLPTENWQPAIGTPLIENSQPTARNSQLAEKSLPAAGCLLPALSGAQALFGIVQGAAHLDLRRESLARTVEVGFDGYALGGLSVGEEKPVMYGVIEEIAPQMPADKPRYLMGVGTPEDLVEAVWRGIDMFDCVIPTRNGRTGQAFTSGGKVNIKNAQWAVDTRPLDENCPCAVCGRHSRAYLRHLYQAGEMLASMLLTHHNLVYFLDTMRRVRQSIRSGVFAQFRRDFIAQHEASAAWRA